MRIRLAEVACLLAAAWMAIIFTTGNPATDNDMTLEDLQWKNRVLLIFFPAKASAETIEKIHEDIKESEEAWKERDFRIFPINSNEQEDETGHPFSEETVKSLHERFEPDPHKVTFVLIGKDGGEKARQTGSLDAKAFFHIVDQMPMRRREMR